MANRPTSQTLGDLLDELARARGDAEAIIWRDRRISYAEWRDQTDRFARGLLSLGIEPGDRVGLLAANRPEWLIAAFAIHKIGAVATAISTFSTPAPSPSSAFPRCGGGRLSAPCVNFVPKSPMPSQDH
jgi:acyl-CoA synthetase (AMP-forming)/AMP-acid ligase II